MKSVLCVLVMLVVISLATGYTKFNNANHLTSPYIYPRLPIVQPVRSQVWNTYLPQYSQFHASSVLPYPGNLNHVIPQQPIHVPAQHPGIFSNMASRLFPVPFVPQYQAYGGNPLLYGHDSKTVTKSVLYSLILNQLADRVG